MKGGARSCFQGVSNLGFLMNVGPLAKSMTARAERMLKGEIGQ